MSISRIKQIKRLLSEASVSYPHNTLDAIRAVVTQPKPESNPAKPVATIKVFDDQGSGKMLGAKIVVQFSKARLEPRHLKATLASVQDLGDTLFGGNGECDDPNCPVHGNQVTDLSELFKKFEEDAIKATGIKKGGLQ